MWSRSPPVSAMDRRRLNLSLSMASPLQREAWAVLSAIREELGGVEFTTEKSARAQGAGDIGSDILGFLLALQENDGGEA